MKTAPSAATDAAPSLICAKAFGRLIATFPKSFVVFALAVGNFAGAQIPSVVVAARLDHYNQVSATQASLVESGFGIEVDFSTPPGPSVAVKLRKPNGTNVALIQEPEGTFYFDELFADQAQLLAAYPNGTYQLSVTGGDADNSVAIAFVGGSVARPRITNFDTLQEISSSSATVSWEAIAAGGDDDVLFFSVERGDGAPIVETQLPSARAISTTVYGLPAAETCNGNLAYVRVNVATANSGSTAIGMTDGFLLTFPLRRVAVAGAPSTPASVGAYASGTNEVTITWLAPASGEPPTGYKLERAANAAFSAGLTAFTLVTPSTSYVDTTVSANATYFYRLSATNTAGGSAPTGAVQVTTLVNPGHAPASFVNISSRVFCSAGSNVAIGGFVISGRSPKHLLVRAVGPTLTTQGLPLSDVLADPVMEVHRGNPTIATNDNWIDNPNPSDLVRAASLAGASALAADDTRTAALLLTLDPGVYTFIARGKGDTSGIVLVEVYDLDGVGPGSAFVNISTRAYSQARSGVAIGGFVVSGEVSKRVLLRAVGPTLATQGLGQTEVLADPVIELHRGQPIIATNDNWSQNANAAAVLADGARTGALPFAPADGRSSALLLTLPPGVYTFIAYGKPNTSGIVLVEVYDAD